MRVHTFNGTPSSSCRELECNQPADAAVHQFVASHGCYYPEVKVSVHVGRETGPFGGTHYADVAWVREDDGSWYSAWFAPHNDSGTYHRVDAFDCTSASQVGMYAVELITGHYTEPMLAEKGMTSQYVPRKRMSA